MLHELFPVPVWEENIGVPDGTLQFVENQMYERMGAWGNTKSISEDKQILEKNPALKKHILSNVKHYAYNILLVSPHVEIEIARSWIVLHFPGDYSEFHTHTNSIWSGVYYIECNPMSGDLIFDKTGVYPNCFLPILEPDTNVWVNATVKHHRMTPEPGSLFVFPSQLMHKADQNQSENCRYCIAFDVFIRGTIGTRHGNEVTL